MGGCVVQLVLPLSLPSSLTLLFSHSLHRSLPPSYSSACFFFLFFSSSAFLVHPDFLLSLLLSPFIYSSPLPPCYPSIFRFIQFFLPPLLYSPPWFIPLPSLSLSLLLFPSISLSLPASVILPFVYLSVFFFLLFSSSFSFVFRMSGLVR